ncbi:hypothetical protein [Agromyces sp. NPDC058064]|uniref:hypothetical protein n=1 Tax=Agromyces sp. NPDC058064 TaxID=3346322 RepID=UPI0036D85EEE
MKLDLLPWVSIFLVVAGFFALVIGIWMFVGPALALVTAGVFCTTLGVALAKGWM